MNSELGAIVYTLTYLAVLIWNALPDGIHFMHEFHGWLEFAKWIGYTIYEDGSIG